MCTFRNDKWNRPIRLGSLAKQLVFSFGIIYNYPSCFRKDITISHEGFYSHLNCNEIISDTLIEISSLFDFHEVYMAIIEAALVDYAGIYFTKINEELMNKLSHLASRWQVCCIAYLPCTGPCRVMMIRERIKDLNKSDILTSSTEPFIISETGY
jgi:hypothetical protein